MAVQVPGLPSTLGELGAISQAQLVDGELTLHVDMHIPSANLQQSLAEALWQQANSIDGVEDLVVELGWDVQAAKPTDASVPNVKNIIAVASGKGGVGKSTTAVNLALALSSEGASVGILDADIYGPSIPTMLGIAGQRPQVVDNRAMVPIEAHGICSISMGVLVTDKTPMVWRGPMASGALQQLLTQTAWPELDYLIIDMPPGTGDIQLTLSQKVPVSGAVVVTTPQNIALLDAKKGVEMFRKVNVPVLGVVENMATHICSNCGHEEHIFGEGGGETLSAEYDTQLLGSLPLSLSIREQADSGAPTVASAPDSDTAASYCRIARRVAAEVHLANQRTVVPTIEISDD